MRPFLMILLSCSSSEEDKASGTPLNVDSDTDSDSGSDSNSGIDTGHTGNVEPASFCGDPDLGIQSFVLPVSGEGLETVYHTNLCIDSAGVSGWYSVSYSTLGGDLICHVGWKILSSSSTSPPFLNLDAWTLSFSGQTDLVGDCLPVLGYLGAYQDMDVSLISDIPSFFTKLSSNPYSWNEWGPGGYEATYSISVADLGNGMWGVDLDDYWYEGVVP